MSEPLIFEKSRAGRRAANLPECDVPQTDPPSYPTVSSMSLPAGKFVVNVSAEAGDDLGGNNEVRITCSLLENGTVFLASSQFDTEDTIFGGGIVFILQPDLTTTIANVVGIGRGADLIFYLSTLFLFFLCFNYHVRFMALEEQLTRIVRELAVRHPVHEEDAAVRR